MRSGTILLTLGALCLSTLLLAESTAGLHWTAPAGWVSKGSAPMRAATYTVEDAECVVYFFGQGQGGSVDANMQRWTGQFSAPGGGHAVPKIGKRSVNGLPVTELDISGTYAGMAGPAMTPQDPKGNTRMLAAIIENPAGNLFVKFTGPSKTITANAAKFRQLVDSFKKE